MRNVILAAKEYPTPRQNGVGLLTLAVGGADYFDQAYFLGLSAKTNMPGLPLAVVTDDTSNRLKGVYDYLIQPDPDLGFGMRQKLYIDHYSPFEETLYVDSDCLVTRPLHAELAMIRKYCFSPVVLRYLNAGESDEWFDDLQKVMSEHGLTWLPKFNGGVFFFNRAEESRKVFEVARRFHLDYRSFGLKPFDRTGPNDEPLFALAMAMTGLRGFSDGGRLMRTPVGLRGKLFIEPRGGGCRFVRAEGEVEPAICHFAGSYRLIPEYFLSRRCLQRNCDISDLNWVDRGSVACNLIIRRITRLLKWRIDSIRKRLPKAVLKQRIRGR